MVNAHDITADLVQERVSDAIRARVGPGKAMTVDDAVAATGLDRRTIDAYRRGESTPCLYKLLRLASVLGPQVLNDILALAGMGGVSRHEAPEGPDSFGVNADLSAALAMFGRHLADGRFDHMELAEQRKVLGGLSERVDEWIAGYDRQTGRAGAVTSLRKGA